MDRKFNRSLVPNAKTLRRNMTKEERHLWYDFLKSYPVKFRRQEFFGKYIADFYSPSAKLVIELDGSQHYEDKAMADDADRTAYLKKYGVRVIRIPNNMIHQKFREVCEYIDYSVNHPAEQ